MKAVTWMGSKKIEVQNVADPTIINPRDCVLRITATAICGSDLHLYDGYVPTMEKGDILGHEFMGEIVAVGREVKKRKVGDRVVVPFTIACGKCHHCTHAHWAACDNTNANAAMVEKLYGYGGAGMFGYSHMMGGYAGGQAQMVRVPFADVGPVPIESDLPDEKVLFLSDIFPTGYQAAENCGIEPGKSAVAIWGAGPVGQFALRSAMLMGAAKVIVIEKEPERRRLAAEAGAIVIDDEEAAVSDEIRFLTGNRGVDAAIDAVGMEAHGSSYDAIKQSLMLESDRPYALRQAIMNVRPGGTLSVAGVYAGLIDKMPFGAVFGKGLKVAGGQTHMHKYLRPLLKLIEDKKIDPSCIITHRVPLTQAADAYEMFKQKKDGCVKVVLNPAA